MSIKDYFKDEATETINSINKVKSDKSFSFCVVTDSHLSDNEENTFENIKCVDSHVGFNCLVHLGDIVCGNIPEKVTRRLLRESLAGYRNSVATGEVYVAQGNHDGYRDESYKGQTVTSIALDEKWYEDTKFADENKNLVRKGDKPYFYVDFPEYKLRFIILCTNAYNHDARLKIFDKIYGLKDEQVEWLGETLLSTPSDYVTFVFSHIPPFSVNKRNPNVEREAPKYVSSSFINMKNSVEMFKAFKNGIGFEFSEKYYDFTNKKGTLAAWVFGHGHGDFYTVWEDINFIEVASQTAYIPQLWKPLGEFPEPRDMGTVNEDAWDAIVIDTDEQKIYFTRFGAGKDRVVKY